MGPGGHINRPRMEVKKSIPRLRRTLKRDRQFNKKACEAARALALDRPARRAKETPVSGKRRRKQLKRLRHIEKEKNAMQVESKPQSSPPVEQPLEKSSTLRRKRKQQQQTDVEMSEDAVVVAVS